jgi:hypothetical protein
VAERRVAEVVRESERLGKVLVEPQGPRQRPRDLAHLDRMGEARAVMVALVEDEDLGLVLQPAEGARMDDTVAVALERAAGRRGRLGMEAAAAPGGVAGVGGAPSFAETVQLRPRLNRPCPALTFRPCVGASKACL